MLSNRAKTLLLSALGLPEIVDEILQDFDEELIFIKRDGTQGPNADVSWEGFKLTELSSPLIGTDAANKDYVDNHVVSLTTNVSGILPVANGGTNLSSLGSALQVLRVNAGGTALEYATPAGAGIAQDGSNSPTANINWNSFDILNLRRFTAPTTNLLAGSATSGSSISSGANNTVYGVGAGVGLSSGNLNTFIGVNAGTSVSTNGEVTAIGANAGTANTATNGTFIGSSAGQSNTTGASNTFIGRRAGQNNITGAANTYVGTAAGINATGSNNTYVGQSVANLQTSGDENVYMGTAAGTNGTAGSQNVYLGRSAGAALGGNTGGSNNVFVGYLSGRDHTTGSNNVFVGHQTGWDNITTASNNVLIGQNVAGTSLTTGGSNVVIGQGAGTSLSSGSSNIIIGAGIEPSSGSASNELIIGSYINASSSLVSLRTQAGSPVIEYDSSLVNIANGYDLKFSSGYGIVDQTDKLVVDANNNTLVTSTILMDTIVLNWADLTLRDFDSQTTVHWGNRELIGPNPYTLALSWSSRELYDFGGDRSLQWDTRNLCGLNGNSILDWNSDTNITVGPTADLTITNGNLDISGTGKGISVVGDLRINTDEYFLTTAAGNTLDWSNGYLINPDDGGPTSVRWRSRELRDSTDNFSANWEDRQLIVSGGSGGTVSVDWELGELYDVSGGIISVNWGTREVNSPNGNSVFSWATDGEGRFTNSQLVVLSPGFGLSIASGADCKIGEATLVAGTVTVSNTSVTANSKIFLSVESPGGTQGHLSYSKNPGTDFTITSTSGTDTSTVSYMIVEEV